MNDIHAYHFLMHDLKLLEKINNDLKFDIHHSIRLNLIKSILENTKRLESIDV